MKEADGRSNVKTFRRLSTRFDDATSSSWQEQYVKGLLTENHRASTLFRGVHTPGVDFVAHSGRTLGASKSRKLVAKTGLVFHLHPVCPGRPAEMVTRTEGKALLGMMGLMIRCEGCGPTYRGPSSQVLCVGCGHRALQPNISRRKGGQRKEVQSLLDWAPFDIHSERESPNTRNFTPFYAVRGRCKRLSMPPPTFHPNSKWHSPHLSTLAHKYRHVTIFTLARLRTLGVWNGTLNIWVACYGPLYKVSKRDTS